MQHCSLLILHLHTPRLIACLLEVTSLNQISMLSLYLIEGSVALIKCDVITHLIIWGVN